MVEQNEVMARMVFTPLLTEFREKLEGDLAEEGAGGIGWVELNAAAMLNDLCEFLGLNREQCDVVLGPSGVAMLDEPGGGMRM